MTTWTERTPGPSGTPTYPKDTGSGRFSMDATDSGLRFKDLGSGRVGLDPTGLYIGRERSGRFSIGLLGLLWLERLAGSTSWTERSAGSTSWTERTP